MIKIHGWDSYRTWAENGYECSVNGSTGRVNGPAYDYKAWQLLEVRRTCSHLDCERTHYAKGLCMAHYKKARRLPLTTAQRYARSARHAQMAAKAAGVV